MADNGKLIYQLTSAEAIKDTDLFVISTDNLTRSITLSQIKKYVNNDMYNKNDITELLDEIKEQIKNVSDDIFEIESNVTEFRNEFNLKLQQLNTSLTEIINIKDKESKDRDTDLDTKIEEQGETLTEIINTVNKDLGTRIDNLTKVVNNNNTSLTNKINKVETDLTAKINGLFSYGTAIPTTLETGKIYLQYF